MLVYAEPEPTNEVLEVREHLAWAEARALQFETENQVLRARVATLEAELVLRDQRIAALEAQVAKLTKMIFGKKSEKMPPTNKEIAKQNGDKADPEKTKQRRKQRDELRKQKAREVEIKHELPEAEKHCPSCPQQPLNFVGTKESVLWEFVPAHFERQVHIQDTWSCPCCGHIVTAPGAKRPTEGGQYGAGFMSHVVVSKCADSMPLYRMEKQFTRMGVPMARSTLCALFHQAANILEPIYRSMKLLVEASILVLADETKIPVLDEKLNKTRQGYIWTFLTEDVAYYRFSATRSGETPVEVLGKSFGTLLVDGYTGYNVVTTHTCLFKGHT